MQVRKKKNPPLFFWLLVAALSFFGFGALCFLIGMNYTFYGTVLPEGTIYQKIGVIIGFLSPIYVMFTAILKLIAYRP